MKQYGLLLMMILGVTFFAAAQKIPTASELTTKNMDALSKKVKLNPTQRNIIYNYTLDLYSAQLALSKKQEFIVCRMKPLPASGIFLKASNWPSMMHS
jgi:protein CpxP